MEIFNREKVIENLLFSLDIPRFELIYDREKGIGPYDPDFFNKSQASRQALEQLAKNALNVLSDEDLWELSGTPGQIDIFAIEHSLFDRPPWYAGGFGVRAYKADYGYWANMDFWTLEEATCLSLGFEPERECPIFCV